jgi:hypothetical protein
MVVSAMKDFWGWPVILVIDTLFQDDLLCQIPFSVRSGEDPLGSNYRNNDPAE